MNKRTSVLVCSMAVTTLIGVGVWSATAGGDGVAPPAGADPAAPRMPMDVGAGERLHVVVGGTYQTRAAAEAAAVPFGDLQGYYVVPTGQFQGLAVRLPVSGRWMLASAFRTLDGAKEFADLARAMGAPALVTDRVVSVGAAYAGLGQEPSPGGRGPLLHAIAASEPLPGWRAPRGASPAPSPSVAARTSPGMAA